MVSNHEETVANVMKLALENFEAFENTKKQTKTEIVVSLIALVTELTGSSEKPKYTSTLGKHADKNGKLDSVLGIGEVTRNCRLWY